MPLIQLLEVLIVVGVVLWLVNRFIPMQGTIKSILNGCGCDCRGSLADECFRAVSLTVANARGHAAVPVTATTEFVPGNTAEVCRKEKL